MLYERYGRALPLFTGNCGPTYVLYATGVPIDSPLFTQGDGNSPLRFLV